MDEHLINYLIFIGVVIGGYCVLTLTQSIADYLDRKGKEK